jgi:hypothetical protein
MQEGSTNKTELLWIAHTANNEAKASNVSLYQKLMTTYSSVNKSKKTPLNIENKSKKAQLARKAVLDVVSGGKDPTGGATFWDGTDFIAWGLNSPDGTPQNKFEEYKSISIPKNIYNEYLNATLKKYSSGKVIYSQKSYDIPADVFKEETNWSSDDFFYNTKLKKTFGIKATGTVGRSIFWKKVQ